MPVPAEPIDTVAQALRILHAHAAGITLDPISDTAPLALAEAYAIEAAVTQARLDRGERVVGWNSSGTPPS